MAELVIRPATLPPLAVANREPVEPTFRRLAKVVNAIMPALGRRDYRDQHKVPQTGGVLFVSNHISHFDPLVLGHYLVWSGRWPRYLGKIQIFHSPWLGWLARACGQIPVDRDSARAKDSLVAAETALDNGKAVTMYPEGTLTGDPDGWPMSGRTGAARLALETGVPVIPIGQWGAQHFMPDGKKGFPFRFGRRPWFSVTCGDPVPLDDLRAQPLTREVLDAASTRIMDSVTALVEKLRGETAPRERWSHKLGARVPVAE